MMRHVKRWRRERSQVETQQKVDAHLWARASMVTIGRSMLTSERRCSRSDKGREISEEGLDRTPESVHSRERPKDHLGPPKMFR
ncbi:hypothetical protein BD309DRAFT_949430 [Dichomitus squalens]|nr:hypothetical protein BD309DRAFT_949430 [Dichomitus squalens]